MPHFWPVEWPVPAVDPPPVLPMRGTCYGCDEFPDGHLLVGDPEAHLEVGEREAA